MRAATLALLLASQARAAAPVEREWAAWRTLFDGAKPAPAPPTPARAGIPVILEAADEEKVKSLFLAAREAQAAWPGYDFFAVPILLVEPGRTAILIGHPRPPRGFEPVPVAGRMVYVSKNPPDIGFDFRIDYPFHGADVAAVLYHAGDRSDQVVPFAIHERFHQFQKDWKDGDHGAYKAEDPEDLALAAVEQEALARALESRDENGLRDFTALRQYRYSRLDAASVEREEERREGTAFYVDHRAAQGAFDSALGVPNLVKLLREPVKLENMGKWRLYATGAAMAAILDRRLPQWQKRIEEGAGPYDLLAQDVSMTPEEAKGRADAAMRTSAYAAALSAARLDVAAAKAKREDAVARFEKLPGAKVSLALSKAGEEPQTYFSSKGWFDLDGATLFDPVVSFISQARLWGIRIENRMLRTSEDGASLSLEFSASSDLDVRLDGRRWSGTTGSVPFDVLDLSEPGLSVHVQQGKTSFDGRRLTITHP